jgi:hypothetical protein
LRTQTDQKKIFENTNLATKFFRVHKNSPNKFFECQKSLRAKNLPAKNLPKTCQKSVAKTPQKPHKNLVRKNPAKIFYDLFNKKPAKNFARYPKTS